MNPSSLLTPNNPLRRCISLAAAVAAVLAGSHSASAQSSGAFTFSGTVSGPTVNSDAVVGLTATKTYLGAYNLGQGAVARTVNGVVFTGAAGINPTVAGVFTTSGLGSQNVGAGAVPGGQLGLVATDFVFGSAAQAFNFTNLVVGQTYVVSYYSKVWDAGARVQNLNASGASVGTTATYDQNTGGVVGSLNILRYTFQAGGTTQTVSFGAAAAPTNHQYGFTLEQTFNNTWTGGANWTTSTWSGGAAVAPNSAGSNANFTAQGVPTTIDLDANRTVGHLQFAGTNAWTVSSTGGSTLTLQSDVGGAATLSALAGTHTIAPNITLSSPTLMKLGAGTVVLNGNITGGTSTVQVGGGNLTLGGTNTYTGVNVIGNGTLEVKSVSDYGVASAIGSRTLAQENATITGVGLHFQGGTLKFTGSTAQSTNRNIRILNGATGATLDASGTVPGATLSFTKTGANMNLFDTGGTRTLNLTGSNTGDNGFSIQMINQGGSATSLTKAGAGTWVLNGVDANTATGVTTVNGGVLKLAKTNVLAVSGGLTIGNGSASAVLQLGGTGGNQIVDPSISVFSGSGANAGILRMNNLTETIGGLSSAAGAGIVENESGAAGTGTLTANMTTTQTFAGILRDGDGAGTDGALAFTKLGAGTQILTGASTHTGATTVSAGTLTVDGSLGSGSAVSVTGATLNGAGTVAGPVAVNAAGVVNGTGTFSGPVTVNAGGLVGGTGTFNLAGATSILSGGTVGGTGAFSGTVTANSGGRISPATSTTVGTLAINALTLGSGSLIDLEFGGTSDLVNVTGAGGLTLNGGAFNLFAAGGVTPLTANGTYTVLDYNTGYGGLLANLGVANAQVGKFYSIADDTVNTVLNLSIADATITEWNGGAADNVWTTDGNWTALAPNSAGTVANFGLIPVTPTNVAVSGAKTVGGIIFNNASSYTVSGGAGDTITMSNGIATAGISVTSGSHTIAAPVVLAGGATSTTAALTTLTVSGDISGANAFTAAGSGTTILTGTNSYGATNVTGGTLQIGNGATIGTIGTGGATVASGASLAFNRSDDLTIASNLGGLGTITKNLSNTLTLTGVNSFGALNIVGGTVKPGNATGIPSGATVAVGAGATFDLNEFNTTIAGLSGAGTVTETASPPARPPSR